ncbi:MAG TPA: Vir protein [Legionella sp.]|nr:Vir protein [Legionella sp.]
MFIRLGAIYGHIWVSLYQTEKLLAFAKKEWSEGLQAFDNATVKEVLLKCREKSAYPPTLPQFIEYCKEVKKRKDSYASVVRATGCTNHSEIAKKHIKSMLEKLRQ